MSHVSTIDLSIEDLSSLETAGKLCGLEMVKQDAHRWYGRRVNTDDPLPEGFAEEDLGKCEYVLRIPGNSEAYEVGVAKRRDGNPGYVLLWDFWLGGKGLEATIGKNGGKLKREYAIAVGMKRMARQGFRTERVMNPATNKPRMRAWR